MIQEITTVQERTPAATIMAAVSANADLTKIRELLEIQKEWEANEAKKAFHLAMSEFKAVPPTITKDKMNKQYSSMYTTLGNLVNTVNPELSKHGLSASWDIEQNGVIKVTCKITHKLGHTEQTSASAPSDTSGAKNPIQQIKSTITYLKAVTFESITGLASTDANVDDDGKASSGLINEWQVEDLKKLLKEKGFSEASPDFLKYMGVYKIEDILEKEYKKAEAAIKAAKKVVK